MHGWDSIFDFNYEADFIHQFDCGWFILHGSRAIDLWMVRVMFGRRSSFILQRSRWGAQILLGQIHCHHHPINVRQRKWVNSSGVCPLLHNLESVSVFQAASPHYKDRGLYPHHFFTTLLTRTACQKSN